MEQNYIRRVTVDWDRVERKSYLRSIPALSRLQSLELARPVTLFAGENGTGKSTLLEAIAVAYGFNPEGGTLNYRFSTYDDVSPLSEAIQLSKGYRKAKWGYFFRAESFQLFGKAFLRHSQYRPDLLHPPMPSDDDGGAYGGQRQVMADPEAQGGGRAPGRERARDGGVSVQTSPRNRRMPEPPVTGKTAEVKSDGQA